MESGGKRLLSSGGERIKADLVLLVVALTWGTVFVAQRVAAAQVGPFFYTGVRFLLGALTLLPFTWRRLRSLGRAGLWGGGLAGVILFAAAVLQQTGLRFTTAGKAGFITGLYVVLVPLFLALVWRQRAHWSVWCASLLAAAGLFLLSGLGRLTLAPGDAWELAGAVAWACHIIVIGRFAPRADVLQLALVQYIVCGLLSTLLALGLEHQTLEGLATAWWSVVYAGVVSVGFAFTLQVAGQRRAPAADAAVILSMESVFAAISGWLFLGETLTAHQLLGCALMLAAMLLAQVHRLAQNRVPRVPAPRRATE